MVSPDYKPEKGPKFRLHIVLENDLHPGLLFLPDHGMGKDKTLQQRVVVPYLHQGVKLLSDFLYHAVRPGKLKECPGISYGHFVFSHPPDSF
jgi:hypothetical protein